MPEGPTAPTTTEEIYAPPTIVEHPALVREEQYVIEDAKEGALVVVAMQAKDDNNEWIRTSKTKLVKYQDFPSVITPAQGVEGEPGYVPESTTPGYTMVRMPDGTDYKLEGVQLACVANCYRYAMTTHVPTNPPVEIPPIVMQSVPEGLNLAEFGILYDYLVQQLVAADQAAKAAQG